MEIPTPRIPLDLVEWLEQRGLQRVPDPETATVPELRTYAAEMRLVRLLRGLHTEQVNPSEDLP